MIFWILNPVPPRGGGGQKFFVYAVCVFGPGSGRTFLLYMDPLMAGVPGPNSRYPPVAPPPPPIWPLASEDLTVFTLDRLFNGT